VEESSAGLSFQLESCCSGCVEPSPDESAHLTTIVAITTVAASRSPKLLPSVASLIIAPRPGAEMVLPRKRTYSATMLAFHAPPDAVTSPVMR